MIINLKKKKFTYCTSVIYHNSPREISPAHNILDELPYSYNLHYKKPFEDHFLPTHAAWLWYASALGQERSICL